MLTAYIRVTGQLIEQSPHIYGTPHTAHIYTRRLIQHTYIRDASYSTHIYATPHRAADRAHMHTQRLIQHIYGAGAQVNARHSLYARMAPLHVAAFNGHAQVHP